MVTFLELYWGEGEGREREKERETETGRHKRWGGEEGSRREEGAERRGDRDPPSKCDRVVNSSPGAPS